MVWVWHPRKIHKEKIHRFDYIKIRIKHLPIKNIYWKLKETGVWRRGGEMDEAPGICM